MAVKNRAEYWTLPDGRSVLRRTIAPAIEITAPTVEPTPLPSWNMRGHIINVRALKGSVFVEISIVADASVDDPEGRDRLLIEDESARWLVWPDSYLMMTEYGTAS
jgi:hypothetical protein